MRGRWVFRGVRLFVVGVAVAFLLAFVVMSLWNWLMPALFARPLITFWQAFGLLLLSKILLGGLRLGQYGGGHWRRRMRERWDRMTPEEQQKFRENMRGRCGWERRTVQET